MYGYGYGKRFNVISWSVVLVSNDNYVLVSSDNKILIGGA